MKDEDKSKEQLISELDRLRYKVAELKGLEARCRIEEQALRTSEGICRAIFDSANDAIFVHDTGTGAILDANRKMCEMYGYTLEEALRLTIGDVSAGRPPFTQEEALAWVDKAMKEGPQLFEWLAKDKTGRVFWVEVSLKRALIWEKNCLLAVVRDITERKAMEEELKKSAERTKLFAYSISHDLKSPAIAIHGLTRLLHKKYMHLLDEDGRKYCDQVLKASEQVVALVERINAYIAAKKAPMVIEDVSIDEVLQTIHDEFSEPLSARRIDYIQPEKSPVIRADRVSMVRIFRNLVDNSLKYGGKELTKIKIEYQESDAFHVFSVSDNGVGMKEEDAERVFGFFQRNSTSKGIEGTGLGLSIVREIAEHHQGKAWIEPGTGRGLKCLISISKGL